MGRTRYQVYKTAAPLKNEETGEICEDIICVTCSSNTNNETGEIEVQQKSLFKIPFQQSIPTKEKVKSVKQLKCEKCKRGRHSLILLIITLTMVLPSLGVFLYIMAESLLHQYAHTYHNKKGPSFRNKLHCLFYSQFCAFCQAERSMDLIGKLQDERLAKMRKYVRNIPLQ